jgi:hypothetical protein
MFGKIVILLLCFLSLALCQTGGQFTANCVISNDPSQSPGSSLHTIVYYDIVANFLRIDYPNLNIPQAGALVYDLYDFNHNVFYQLCKTCSAFLNQFPRPTFYYESTDTSVNGAVASIVNDKGQTCLPFATANPTLEGGVQYVWVTTSNVPCQAQKTDGTTYTFSNVVLAAPASSVFALPATPTCPKTPVCGAPIDLVLVMDESGSINRTEWAELIAFANAVVQTFIIGPTQTQIGLVFFSGRDYFGTEDPSTCCGFADPVLPLSFDETTILKFLNTHNQTGGHTCINCGIRDATAYEPNPNRAVVVPKVMLVVTDGFNNRETAFFTSDIAAANAAGWNIFAIGVGPLISVDQLTQVASQPTSTHLFLADNFNALQYIKGLFTGICNSYPTANPCGSLCKGKCICGGQCVCPDTCTAGNLCQTSQCVQNVSGSGCFATNKFCDPTQTNGNLCQQNVCNQTTGQCTLSSITCNAPDSCFTTTCDPTKGCIYTDGCAAQQLISGTTTPSLCLNRACNNATSTCTTTTVTCPVPANQCSTGSCDPVLGCVNSTISCDDGNACTTDSCNPSSGCQHVSVQCPAPTNSSFACLNIICDPKVGCTTTNKSCDDGNICTTDSCNPSTGCLHTSISCVPDLTDLCHNISCDPVLGCIKTPNVTCNDGLSCTTDACVPSTGLCTFTPIVCPSSGNPCTSSVCSESAKGCVNQTTTLCNSQPTNLCQTSTCNATTNTCQVTSVTCAPTNLCQTVRCDPAFGCISTPKICNDGVICTIDTCDITTGNCVFTPVPSSQCNSTTNCTTPCVSTDPCNPRVCQNGTCIVTPVVCASSTKCGTIAPVAVGNVCQCNVTNPVTCPSSVPSGQCGEYICDPVAGCIVSGGRVCNDNNPCTIDTCAVVNGTPTCQYTAIPCPGDSPCSRQKCVNVGGVASCQNDTANTINCTTASGSQCVTGTCNVATGTCQYTTNPCSQTVFSTCSRLVCNPATRLCQQSNGLQCSPNDPLGCGINGVCILVNGTETCSYSPSCPINTNLCNPVTCIPSVTGAGGICKSNPLNCNDNNPCTVNDACIIQNGAPTCSYTPFSCPLSTSPCTINQCVNVSGQPQCVATPVVCNATNNTCSVGKCVVENGKGVCVYTPLVCGTNDKCSIYQCDPVHGCNKTNKCNDNNPCTNDICNPTTGNCTYTNVVCNSSSVCSTGICNPNSGCVQTPVNCANLKNISALLDPCHFPICAANNGCQVAVIPNTLDACGFCNQPGKCNPRSKSKIPAGAIAGAVIGGSVVAGAAAIGIGALFASKSAAGFGAGSDGAIVGAAHNPLYAQGNHAGDNPFHNNDYVPLGDK